MEDSCLKRASSQQKEASGISVFLLEELGDARLRCAQLKKYIDEAVKLIDKSQHRDHFFEVAAHLIYGIPDTLLRLDKALGASALAASKLDYEEIKDDLRPEKVDELERALEEVRIRRVRRQSTEGSMDIQEAVDKLEHFASQIEKEGQLDPQELAGFIDQLEEGHKTASETTEIPEVLRSLAAGIQDTSRPENRPSRVVLASTLRRVLAATLNMEALKTASDDDESKEAEEAKESRFEEGKPADPTKNMDPSDAKAWKSNTDKYEDKFKKSAEMDPPPTLNSESGVLDALNNLIISARKAQQSASSGDAKKMFFHLMNVLNAVGTVGKAYDADSVGYLVRVWKSFGQLAGTRPMMNFASEDEFKKEAEDRRLRSILEDAWIRGDLANDPATEDTQGTFERGRQDLLQEIKIISRTLSPPLLLHKVPKGRIAYLSDAVLKFVYGWGLLSSNAAAKTASDEDDKKESRFEEGKPADPTQNMSPEDAKKWKTEHDKNKDKFKSASSGEPSEDEEKRSRFEEGKPADPTENMSPEDKKKWEESNDKYEDKFKEAARYVPGDPRWITAKYPGQAQDGTKFNKGDLVLYWPRTKTFMVGAKAEAAWRRFESEVEDEEVYNRSMYADKEANWKAGR